MPWVQAFPTNNTLINQSVNQIQQNWLAIQNNINTDHFFNTGAPNEGHHNVINMPRQAAHPALALDGSLYVKTAYNSVRPYFRSALEINQIPTVTGHFPIVLGEGFGPFNVIDYDFPHIPDFFGFVMVADNNNWVNSATAVLRWASPDGPHALYVNPIAVSGTITGIGSNGTFLTINKTNPAMNLRYALFKYEVD